MLKVSVNRIPKWMFPVQLPFVCLVTPALSRVKKILLLSELKD